MTEQYLCWKCGTSIEGLPLPLSRLAKCPNCEAELHVCKLCEFYDEHVAEQCQETIADYVKDKESANFCEYFSISADAYHPQESIQTGNNMNKLNELFGLEDNPDQQSTEDKARAELDALFKK